MLICSRSPRATAVGQRLLPAAIRTLPITTGQVLGIDARLFLVVAPILAAVSWAAFNIGRAAVGQLQLMLKRSRA